MSEFEITGNFAVYTELIKKAEEKAAFLIEMLKKLFLKAALAESCTAGLVSSLLGCIPGASRVLWGSFVCYSKEAKISMLGLDEKELETNGLASRDTACKMAIAALKKSGADLAAAITGVAGPCGDGSCVPVGTVWVATALNNGKTKADEFNFTGSRNEVRIHAAIAALEMMTQALDINLKK
jgi:PncC family amidohydrolase